MNYLTVVGTCVYSLGAPVMMKKKKGRISEICVWGYPASSFTFINTNNTNNNYYYYRRRSDLYGFDTAHPSRIGSRSSLADSDGENVIAAAFPQGPSPEKRNLRRLKYGSNCDVKPK